LKPHTPTPTSSVAGTSRRMFMESLGKAEQRERNGAS
jgi:hypothetical protein